MALPNLDARGLLPAGTHDTTLDEIAAEYCTNERRTQLWTRFQGFLRELRDRVGVGELYLAGSFFSDKAAPEDIEATVKTSSDYGEIGVTMMFAAQRQRIKQDYEVDFYASLPGQNNFVDYFRYVGPKAANEKGLKAKDRRGIVRVQKWANG